MEKDRVFALKYALTRGFQIHPDAFEILKTVPATSLEKVIKDVVRQNTKERRFQITGDDLESYLGLKDDDVIGSELRVLSDPTGQTTTAEGVEGYGALFRSRYESLKQIMSERPEARRLRPLSGAGRQTKDDEDVYVAGLVWSREAERGRARLGLEDPTGESVFPVYDDDLQREVGTLLQDQFVMARIGHGPRGVFVKDVMRPDMPSHPARRSDSEAYAVFISDLHVGSKYFMEQEFEDFVSWLSEPDAVARKTRFVLICGDVVDGVGIYKDQDKELVLSTVEDQLGRLEELLSKVPPHIKIIISPGNHDPGRRALPQPAIPEKYCPGLWGRNNITMVGNPTVVSLNGVRVLMFHGQSIDDIVKVTPGLSYDKPTDVMRHLLMARHLSPIYGGTPIAPEVKDWMVIEDGPDVFHVGHVHRWGVDMYKGTLLVNSGAWQQQTPFQMSVGIVPNPGIATVLNLKTFDLYHQNFNPDQAG